MFYIKLANCYQKAINSLFRITKLMKIDASFDVSIIDSDYDGS